MFYQRYLSLSVVLGLLSVSIHSHASVTRPEGTLIAQASQRTEDAKCPNLPGSKNFDVIVFGDEVPGVMAALKVKRELRLRGQKSRVALITEGEVDKGIGGHLVRGGLAYLDRNQVPVHLRSKYGIFGTPNRLYQEFLGHGRVKTIALDRKAIAQSFKRTLQLHDVDVIGNVELEAAHSAGMQLCSLTVNGQTYTATQFIDASQSGELAEVSGVEVMKGLGALGFPDSTLSTGLVLELYGVTIEDLKRVEARLIQRFLDPQDSTAQRWLAIASGNNPSKRQDMLQTLLDKNRNPKLLYQATPDSADVRSLAFSLAIHGRLGREYNLKTSGFLFDRANIAVFPDRLSLNALLFYANAEQARQLSKSGAKPTTEMLAIANEIKALFERFGIPDVKIMDELYVRHAGQIANPLDELSATLMTAGGLPAPTALGTFGYHLDDRGGIEGLDERIEQSSLQHLNFRKLPVFNYGFRHTLPKERQNLSVLGPASGFGGLGTTAGRIIEMNVGVGEGVAIAIAIAISEGRTLQSIGNLEVRKSMGYTPAIYGFQTGSFQAIFSLERELRSIDYEENYLQQAQTFLIQGNFGEAARVLSRAIALEPQNANTYYLRGKSLFSLRLWDYARSDFTDAIRLNPTLTDALIYRGYVNLFDDNYNQAIDDFKQVLQRDGTEQNAQLGQALALSFQKSATTGHSWYEDALPWLTQTITEQPKFATAHIIRGIALAKSGDLDAARADFEKAITLHKAQGDQLAVANTQRIFNNLVN